MRFEQTRDVLNHARDFHRKVSDFYHELEEQSDQKRVRLLLDYMAGREKELADALDDFVNQASTDVLNTWFQFTHDDDTLQLNCPDVEVKREMSVDDVMSMAMRFHDCLMRLYGELAGSARSNRVREVFLSLMQEAEKEWERLERNAQSWMDL